MNEKDIEKDFATFSKAVVELLKENPQLKKQLDTDYDKLAKELATALLDLSDLDNKNDKA